MALPANSSSLMFRRVYVRNSVKRRAILPDRRLATNQTVAAPDADDGDPLVDESLGQDADPDTVGGGST